MIWITTEITRAEGPKRRSRYSELVNIPLRYIGRKTAQATRNQPIVIPRNQTVMLFMPIW